MNDIINKALIEKIEQLESEVSDLKLQLDAASKPIAYNNKNDAVADLKNKVAIGQRWLHLKTDVMYNSKTGQSTEEPPFVMEVSSIDIILRGKQYRKYSTVNGYIQMPKNMADWELMLPDETIEQCLSRVARERAAILDDDRLKQKVSDFTTSRDASMLASSGIHTVADILQYNQEQLMKIESIGHKTAKAIEQHLNEQGLYLGMLKNNPNL